MRSLCSDERRRLREEFGTAGLATLLDTGWGICVQGTARRLRDDAVTAHWAAPK